MNGEDTTAIMAEKGHFRQSQIPADPLRAATSEYSFAFDGWYDDAIDSSKVTVDLTYLNTLTTSTTLYANWAWTPIVYNID